MAALTEQRQNFVEALIRMGAGPDVVVRAAAEAGYSENHGWKLMREPKVLAAVREEANKRLLSGALLGASVLMEIAMKQTAKDEVRLKAARELLAHNGFMPVQKVEMEVKHTGEDTKTLIKEILEFAKTSGLDGTRLLGSVGVIVDADFTEVETDATWCV